MVKKSKPAKKSTKAKTSKKAKVKPAKKTKATKNAKKPKSAKTTRKPTAAQPKKPKTAPKKQAKATKAKTSKPATPRTQRGKAAKTATPPTPAGKPARASSAPSSTVALGSEAPSFSLPTDTDAIDLASFRGRKNVVLYFYPKDDTPGCTVQACTFEKDAADFASHDAVVVGVSADSADSHARFRRKYNLNFPLIVDEGAKLANQYGVWVEKNNYGKRYMGIQRTTFLIDKQGKVAAVWPRVKVDGHSAEVLSALRGLS